MTNKDKQHLENMETAANEFSLAYQSVVDAEEALSQGKYVIAKAKVMQARNSMTRMLKAFDDEQKLQQGD